MPKTSNPPWHNRPNSRTINCSTFFSIPLVYETILYYLFGNKFIDHLFRFYHVTELCSLTCSHHDHWLTLVHIPLITFCFVYGSQLLTFHFGGGCRLFQLKSEENEDIQRYSLIPFRIKYHKESMFTFGKE